MSRRVSPFRRTASIVVTGVVALLVYGIVGVALDTEARVTARRDERASFSRSPTGRCGHAASGSKGW